MLYGRELLGLPVYTQEKKLIGTVKSYETDRDGVLQSLLVTTTGLIARDMRLPAAKVISMSLKGVYIADKKNLQKQKSNQSLPPQQEIVGSSVFDSGGKCLGNISDVMLENGRISAVELSSGLYGDLSRGRSDMPFAALHREDEGFVQG